MYRYPHQLDSNQWSHFKGCDVQGWAKEHAIEQKVHLSYNLHIAGLVERKNEIIKQQNKLRMSKTIPARWTKVLSHDLIHLNDQQVRLRPLLRRPVP